MLLSESGILNLLACDGLHRGGRSESVLAGGPRVSELDRLIEVVDLTQQTRVLVGDEHLLVLG